MKTRQGFVSNSSSSSFIIEAQKHSTYKTVWDVAKAMLETRQRDYASDPYSNEENKEVIPASRIIQEVENLNMPLDTPITMHSVQYETYIYKKNGKIYVDTCNNVPWDLDVQDSNTEFGDGLYYSPEDGDTDKDRDYSDIDFFHIDYGIFASEPKYSDKKKCNCTGYSTKLKLVDGSILCTACDAEQIKTLKVRPRAIEFTGTFNRLSVIE